MRGQLAGVAVRRGRVYLPRVGQQRHRPLRMQGRDDGRQPPARKKMVLHEHIVQHGGHGQDPRQAPCAFSVQVRSQRADLPLHQTLHRPDACGPRRRGGRSRQQAPAVLPLLKIDGVECAVSQGIHVSRTERISACEHISACRHACLRRRRASFIRARCSTRGELAKWRADHTEESGIVRACDTEESGIVRAPRAVASVQCESERCNTAFY